MLRYAHNAVGMLWGVIEMTDTGYTAPSVVPPVPTYSDYRRHAGRSATFWGIMLIVLGAAFLAAQFMPGMSWWMAWPLIFVVAGFAQMVTPRYDGSWTVQRVFDGLGTVLFSLVLLGNTTGYISWGVWWTLLTLWPVLLIALGVSIIGSGVGAEWVRGLAHVVVWAALAFAVAMSIAGLGGFHPSGAFATHTLGQHFSFAEKGDGVSEATLDLQGAAGDLRIHSGSDLIAASGTSAFGQPELSVQRSGSSATVVLGPGHGLNDNELAPGLGGEADVRLSDSVVWDATIKTGASSVDADLSDLKVRRLTLKSGASSSTVRVGEVPMGVSAGELIVKSGVSNVVVYVPATADVRLTTRQGLSSIDVPSRFESRGAGVYETPGYSAQGRVWNIDVESGVGSVSVRTY